VFDPIGFLCPALLPLKLLFQNAWVAKSGWDDELPQEAMVNFRRWHAELSCLQHISISRDITGGCGYCGSRLELHTFCDASKDAYAAVVYLRAIGADGTVSVQLLMAKSRLAPLKKPTIPRMELLASVIGARLTSFVRKTLNLSDFPSLLWSDSTTALAWSEPMMSGAPSLAIV